MAKENKTKDIVDRLLAGNYSQREISRTLKLSQTTVNNYSKYLKTFLDSGHTKEELANKSSCELDCLLIPYEKRKATLQDEDFEVILCRLGATANETATHLLNSYKNELKNNDLTSETSKLSKEGKDYLMLCPYQTFIFNLHRFCESKNYSDRFLFKPGQHLEIGTLPIENTSENLTPNTKSPKKRDFLFYLYFPFSRKTSVTIIKQDKDIADQVITSIILFLAQHKGLPAKIVIEKDLDEMFKEASSKKTIELKPLRDFLKYCNLLHSVNKKYCVFKEKEDSLQQNISRILELQKTTSRSKDYQSSIDNECYAHNKDCTNTLDLENEYLQNRPYPKNPFVHNIKDPRRLNLVNCHVKFHYHWYSSKYTCQNPSISLEFGDNNFKLITKTIIQEKEVLLSEHPLFPKGRYSTNAEDLPPTDIEAEKYNLKTKSELMKRIEGKFTDPVVKVINEYVNTKDFPQHAFVVLNAMGFITNNERIEKINETCASLIVKIENKTPFSWKELTDSIFIKQETVNKEEAQTTYANSDNHVDDDSDIPF